MSSDQQSDRQKAISVLLYVLGLSYGAVEDLLDALGVAIGKPVVVHLRDKWGKTTVYENVQEAGMVSRSGRARRWPKARHGW